MCHDLDTLIPNSLESQFKIIDFDASISLNIYTAARLSLVGVVAIQVIILRWFDYVRSLAQLHILELCNSREEGRAGILSKIPQ